MREVDYQNHPDPLAVLEAQPGFTERMTKARAEADRIKLDIFRGTLLMMLYEVLYFKAGVEVQQLPGLTEKVQRSLAEIESGGGVTPEEYLSSRRPIPEISPLGRIED